jgi:hypothetical protein
MINCFFTFFKCCKDKRKTNEEEDINIVNSDTEIRKILTDYNIEDCNFKTFEEERLIQNEIKDQKKDNNTIITIENGDKRAVDIDSNKIKNEGIEIFKSLDGQNLLINNISKEESKSAINNSSLNIINIRDNILLNFIENDPDKILVTNNYIRDDERDHIIFVILKF